MKTRRDFLKLAGASLVGVTGIASASENPFGFAKMESGYTQVAMEGKCGEGKCGGKSKYSDDKHEHGEGKSHSKKMEGKCGEGKCGGKAKMTEGKCGEGKCGGKSKASEGKCGEGKCGGMRD